MITKYTVLFVVIFIFCAALTMAYIVLPLQIWKHQISEGWSFLISDYHLTFQQRFHHDLYHNQSLSMLDQLVICIQYSLLTCRNFSHAFVLMGLLLHFMPMIQGILYTFLPEWASELPGKIIECLSGDESEPPELEIDPSATTFASISSRNVSSNSLTSKGSNGVSEKSWRIRALAALNSDESLRQPQQKTTTTSDSLNSPVRHVFDPVFGVIPEDVRDRWSSSSSTLDSTKKENGPLVSSSESSTRWTSHGGDTTVSPSVVGEDEVDADKKNIGIRVSRVLPPVRYSLSPTVKAPEISQGQGLTQEIEQNTKD